MQRSNVDATGGEPSRELPDRRAWVYRLAIWWARILLVVIVVILGTGGSLWWLGPVHLLLGFMILPALRYIAYFNWKMSMWSLDKAMIVDVFNLRYW